MAKLVLIDGPPGAGKSTLAETLADRLPESRLLLEMDPLHPLHPVPVSDWGADFLELPTKDVDEMGQLLLSKWSEFLREADSSNAYILESYPYQSHVRVLWQMSASPVQSSGWLGQLHQLLADHDVLLVTLNIADAEAHTRLIFERRGPEWAEFIATFISQTELGKARGFADVEGAIQCLTEYIVQLSAWVNAWPYAQLRLNAWEQSPREFADQIAAKFCST